MPLEAGQYCLIVEDNAFALSTLSIYLGRHGFRVDAAENGQIALDKYLADPNRYFIIFMDLQMPVMSGHEAVRRIRGSGHPNAQSLPIIAMTGDPGASLHALGFNHHLKKPFEMQAVLAILREVSSA